MTRAAWMGSTGLALVLALGGVATAQTLQPSAPPAPTASDAAGAVSEVVVTGSRLKTTILDSPVPVVAVTSRQLEETGTDNLARAITQLPSVATGISDANSQNFFAASGLNLVDLRRLGYNRTLVLVNGRRQVPGDIYTSAVDLNSIPAPLVDRVEVQTGGTSAVYGADAVSGVINVITKDHYDGLEARLRGGISSQGDSGSYGISFLAGRNFDEDKGNITLGFDYDRVDGVKATARDYASNGIGTILNPAYTGPTGGQPIVITRTGIRYGGAPVQLGLIDLGPYGQYVPINNGTAIRPFDNGSLHSIENINVGGDGGFFQKYDNLSLPTERFAFSGNATYKLSNEASLFFEARVSSTHVKTLFQPPADFEYGNVFIKSTNPYVPQDLAGALAGAGAPGFYFGRVYEDFPYRGASDDRTTQQYTGGLRGRLMDRFDYQLYAGYGRTDLSSDLFGGRNQAKFLQSIDVATVNGQPACADPAARAAGCQPLNVFYPAGTPAGIAYSTVTDTYAAMQDLKVVSGDISGDVFTLPAGPVSVALGAEYRENHAETHPSAQTQQGGIQLLYEAPEAGTVTVGEVFGETRIPLLKNLPLIKELTFQAAGRYSDYNINGGQFSWNLGGVWSPVDALRFRVMRSRSVRAPNVTELYASVSQTFLPINDPCSIGNTSSNANRPSNCAALGIPAGFLQGSGTKATYVGGNPKLDVETADTLTVGLTYAPPFIRGLSFTVDYFDIDIDGAIGSIPAQTLVDNCVDQPISPGSNPNCAAVTRDANHQISAVNGVNLNIGKLQTRGVDFTADYSFPIERFIRNIPGRVQITATGTYLDKLRQFTDANDPTSEIKAEGFLGSPKWQLLGTVTYTLDKLSVTWRTRFIDSMYVLPNQLVASPRPSYLFDYNYTGAETYNDLSIAYDFTPRTNLRLNIDNIFDEAPPQRGFGINEGLGNGGINGATIYPNLGRLFSFVVSHKF